MICGQKTKTKKAMVAHIKLKHKEILAKDASKEIVTKNTDMRTVAKREKTYLPWYIIFGLITTFVIGVFITNIISLPHVNTFLLYVGSISLYALFCVLILGFSLDTDHKVLQSFMIGTLGILPGLIVESLFHESKGRNRFYFAIALFLSWLSTIAIVFMIFAVLTFVIG
jgi:hypothetical protein